MVSASEGSRPAGGIPVVSEPAGPGPGAPISAAVAGGHRVAM